MTIAELRRVVEVAHRRFAELRARHRPFRGYLVLSSRLGQVEVDSSVREHISRFPEMFVDTEWKRLALDIIRRIRTVEKDREARRKPDEDAEALEADWKQTEPRLAVADDTQLEIRFGPIVQDNNLSLAERGNLDYGLIAELQRDPLVDAKLTPQTPASIRIGLGTLRSFR